MDAHTETQVLGLIADACASQDVLSERDMDLFESGFLDSLAFVELLVGFEEVLGVVIQPTEVERTEVSTINRILTVIDERLP